MFTGTPCYVSGLKKFLSVRKADTEKAVFMRQHLSWGGKSYGMERISPIYTQNLSIKGKTVKMLSMRSKKTKWQKQYMDCITEYGDESHLLNKKASWNKLYLTTYATRKSCFSCPFTGYERVGDITVADYWNIENAKLNIDYKSGVSLLLINTAKGKEWFAQCEKDLIYEKSDKKSCWQIHLEKTAANIIKTFSFLGRFQKRFSESYSEILKGFFV